MEKILTGVAIVLLMTIAILVMPVGFAVTWGSDELPVNTLPSFDLNPSIAQAIDGKIWVAWQSDILGDSNILYDTYNGTSWAEAGLLTNHLSEDISPSIVHASNGTIWLFWSSDRTGNYDIFFKTSNDGGSTWSNETPLTTDLKDDNSPSAVQAVNGTIAVVWQRRMSSSNYDLFYKVFNGSSWTNQIQLTENPSLDQVPSIAQTLDGNIWVAWSSYRTGNFEIFYRIYNGTHWSDPTQRTTSSYIDECPSIVQARDGTIWIFWASAEDEGTPTSTYDLYYQNSSDNGANWSETYQLTTDPDHDRWPSAAQINDEKIWVAWTTNRLDVYSFDIFYTTSSEIIDHDVAITSVTPSPTMVDPGENVSVNVVAENWGEENKTFVVRCSADSRVIGYKTVSLTPANSTTLTFLWNTSDIVTGGIFTISATATCGATWVDTLTDGTVLVTFHDVAVMSVSPSEPSVGQGCVLKIYVEVKNKGVQSETFSVTAYCNTTEIGTQTITDLDPDTSTTLTFLWDTTGFSFGNYTISATAHPVTDEMDTADNSLTDGTVRVKIAGDVNGDGIVNIEDIDFVVRALGSDSTWPEGTDWNQWNPDCDIDNDLTVNFIDLIIASSRYGEVEE